MQSTDFSHVKNYLESNDFTKVENYSKNKRHVQGIIKNLSNASQDQIKELLPSLEKSINNLKAAQVLIKEQKLKSCEGGITGFLQRTKIAFKDTWYASTRLNSLVKSLDKILLKKGITYEIAVHSPKDRFKNISYKITSLAKGATKPGSKILSEEYWQETIGMKLNIDGKSYSGRMYMGSFSTLPERSKASYLDQWKKGTDQNGVPYQSKYSFEEFMNEVKIPTMNEQEKNGLIAACESIVEYYEPQELEPLKIHFSEGKVSLPSSQFNNWLKLWENQQVPKISYREFLQSQSSEGARPTQLDNFDGRFMYVLRGDGSLVLQIKQYGKANHTSLSGGHAVLAAGHVAIHDGKIVTIDTQSGHYKPSITQIMTMLEFLQKNRVDVNGILITYSLKPNEYADMDQVQKGKASEWMQKQKKALIDKIEQISPIDRNTAENIPYARLESMLMNLEKQ